jgi:hypothetical protein
MVIVSPFKFLQLYKVFESHCFYFIFSKTVFPADPLTMESFSD